MAASQLAERIAEIDNVISSIIDILELAYENLSEVNYKCDKLREDLEVVFEHTADNIRFSNNKNKNMYNSEKGD